MGVSGDHKDTARRASSDAQLTRSLYISGSSWLHRLHPLTKLSYAASTALIVFTAPGGGWSAAVLLAASLLLGMLNGLGRPIWSAFLRLAALGGMLLAVHSLFNPANVTPLVTWGVLTVYREGFSYALLVLTRLAAALSASLLLVFSVHPADLMLALAQAGLPPGAIYLFGSPLLLLPQMQARAEAVLAAQRARGLETEGNLLQRMLALFPTIAPLIFSALMEVEDRAIALEMRAFRSTHRKTSLRRLDDARWQKVFRWAMWIAALGVMLIGIWWRLNG